MSAIELKAYELFKKHFSESEAQYILDYVQNKAEEKSLKNSDMLLTKDDKVELLLKIENYKTELLLKIESTKTDMIKWFFAFFFTLALMIAGLYLKH